ncbi:hypothetical protein GO755_33495 [Spirosoma sp. HMF4905]|uniref:Uncharacterized protein n=1 Tax=Spirosoma arboris TaxID=2682092 RepID=A0A7K1SMG0_9BACT|nr:hypothetical protein [Spirosoma arboris]MVM34991.1 hypothetical protein [Spirosoma arboris]
MDNSTSFWSNLFGSGGAGSSLISSAGSIGQGLVKNEGDQIRGDYQVKLAQLTNDATLSKEQFDLSLAKLQADRDSALATYNDQKRNDTLVMVGIIGGLLLIATVSVLLILKRKAK